MKSQTTALLMMVLFVVCGPLQTVGFSQCMLFSGPETLREYRDAFDIVIEGELVFCLPANEERDFPGRCAVKIQKFIKDASKVKEFEVNQIITLKEETNQKVGDRILLCSRSRAEESYWIILEKSSPAVVKYAENAPAENATQTEQLAYFLPFLEHPDPVIAHDALLEVSSTSELELIASLKELRGFLDRDQLRNWIANDPTEPTEFTRQGVYALFLGLCGNEDDAKLLKSILQQDRDEPVYGTSNVIVGYLLLTGDRGLDFIDETILKKNDASFYDQFAVLQALRYMKSIPESQVSSQRLSQSMYVLLEQPEIADLVICDLGRWKDWSVMDRVVSLHLDNAFNSPDITREIVYYLINAIRSWDKSASEVPPEHVLKAQRHLITFEELEPHTVSQAKNRFIFFD